jgi:UDP-N-acetylglucosamine--N-acetylmuramyl-(pentapeptide) pyrophosphoryl-undecaprenol N-acetylglucosamine transferase
MDRAEVEHTPMKVLFTGGGTAGHVTPNVALIEELHGDGIRCDYVGSKNGIENEIISQLNDSPAGSPQSKIAFHSIASGKLRRYFDWQNFTDPFRVILGFFQSLIICLKLRPDMVFSKGGFVAVPIVLAARLLRIPVICHESDVTPGLANKICFPFAQRICLNFYETRQYLSANNPAEKIVVTGTPIRRSLLQGNAAGGRQALGITDAKPIVLIFGGSLGSEVINQQVRRVLDKLTSQFTIVHVVGAGAIDHQFISRQDYIQREYISEDFGDVLAASELVISRAGANSIYELLVVRKPHILIPLSARASRGDQLVNARTFRDAGYSDVIEEENLNDESFLQAIEMAFANREQRMIKLAEFAVHDSVSTITKLIKSAAAGEL